MFSRFSWLISTLNRPSLEDKEVLVSTKEILLLWNAAITKNVHWLGKLPKKEKMRLWWTGTLAGTAVHGEWKGRTTGKTVVFSQTIKSGDSTPDEEYDKRLKIWRTSTPLSKT